jgi:hypothetical protein
MNTLKIEESKYEELKGESWKENHINKAQSVKVEMQEYEENDPWNEFQNR